MIAILPGVLGATRESPNLAGLRLRPRDDEYDSCANSSTGDVGFAIEDVKQFYV